MTDPFYGIGPGAGPAWVSLGSTHQVELGSLPQAQQDAIMAMVGRLRELFSSDPFAFDVVLGWLAAQIDDGDLDHVPIFRALGPGQHPWCTGHGPGEPCACEEP